MQGVAVLGREKYRVRLAQEEQTDMTVTLTNLSPLLAKSKEFTIQVKPNRGAVVIVNRTTPLELRAISSLN